MSSKYIEFPGNLLLDIMVPEGEMDAVRERVEECFASFDDATAKETSGQGQYHRRASFCTGI